MRKPFEGDYPVTLPFGSSAPPYSSTRRHRGTDYGTPTGVRLLSPQAGYAQQMEADDFGENTQIDGERYLIILAHESSQLGEGWVTEGQHVAYSGASGWASGPHVHVQVLDKETGQWVDFETLLNGGGVVEPPDYRTNDGDNVNIKKKFGYSPSDPPNLSGEPWKSVYENWISGKIDDLNAQIASLKKQLADAQNAQYEPVGQLYRRKV